jgi:hypothetical protein
MVSKAAAKRETRAVAPNETRADPAAESTPQPLLLGTIPEPFTKEQAQKAADKLGLREDGRCWIWTRMGYNKKEKYLKAMFPGKTKGGDK